MTPKPSVASASPTPIGLNPGWLYAVLAYGSWGLLPIYWKFFQQISAVEVLTQRIIWSLVFLSAILIIQGRWQEFAQLKQRPQHILGLLLSATLLTCNWGLYIYGVNSDRVIETSLGYFINPLVTVLLGFVFLQERLRWGQRIAVGLATLGVGYFIWQFGAVPWIGLGLAFTFAFYGLLRKLVPVNPMVGLAVETGLITPAAIAAVGYWAAQGSGHLGTSLPITLLFIGAGVVTSMPLLWFNNAAKRLRLSTLGLFQYVAPSIQLALGVFLYQEPFTTVHGVTFGCIWSALALYSITSLRSPRSSASA